MWNKDSDQVLPGPHPGDLKRPDPTVSVSAKLILSFKGVCKLYMFCQIITVCVN